MHLMILIIIFRNIDGQCILPIRLIDAGACLFYVVCSKRVVLFGCAHQPVFISSQSVDVIPNRSNTHSYFKETTMLSSNWNIILIMAIMYLAINITYADNFESDYNIICHIYSIFDIKHWIFFVLGLDYICDY